MNQNRFLSPVTLAAVGAQIVSLLVLVGVIDTGAGDAINKVLVAVLEALTVFGVLNNPTATLTANLRGLQRVDDGAAGIEDSASPLLCDTAGAFFFDCVRGSRQSRRQRQLTNSDIQFDILMDVKNEILWVQWKTVCILHRTPKHEKAPYLLDFPVDTGLFLE